MGRRECLQSKGKSFFVSQPLEEGGEEVTILAEAGVLVGLA